MVEDGGEDNIATKAKLRPLLDVYSGVHCVVCYHCHLKWRIQCRSWCNGLHPESTVCLVCCNIYFCCLLVHIRARELHVN